MTAFSPLLEIGPATRWIRHGTPDLQGRCVLYWMQRSQRAVENPAVNRAIELGNALGLPVLAVLALTPSYPGAQRRHYRFLLDGLPEIQQGLLTRGVPLVVRIGEPPEVVAELAGEVRPALVVGDENPLHVGQRWRTEAARRLAVPFQVVDADVVVPTARFPKEEYAARTLRPKIRKLWDDALRPIPNPVATAAWNPSAIPRGEVVDPGRLLDRLKVGGAGEVAGYRGGTAEALRRLERFVRERLPHYATQRNEPTPCVTSELSAHLHFGHISPVTIALAVRGSGAPRACIDAYLEELIVRRELAVNFVARNPDHDRIQGCPGWALRTLARHASDPRPRIYTAAQLESAETHDPLWNAAQKEMVLTGRMHNYLRMYWAKQLLLWTPDPETAFEIAVDLNDRYEMDGRDPNGYAGIAWAIGGKHDRPWPERPVFGTVRAMSYESTRRKFDSEAYIRRINQIERGRGS